MDAARTGSTGSESSGRIEGYIQNAEQSESSIWQKVKQAKGQQ
jgi:hypothetical protein